MLRPLLLALAAVPLCLAASNSPVEKFSALAEKSSDGVIRLDESLFDELTSAKRDWSVVVQLTALGKNMKCTPCKDFDPSFRAVAKAWSSVPKAERSKHFFATADFADAEGVFRKLNLMSAPVVTYYPATQGPNKLPSGKTDPFNYDFNNFGNDAKELALQLSNFTPVPIPYKVPIDWGLVLSVIASLTLFALTARLLFPVILSRWTWAFVTISTILVMTSGFMFVRIRGMPYRTREHSMMPGFQSQVGAEIWAVSFKYFVLSASFLGLTLGAPRQPKKTVQKMAIYAFTLLIVLTFSALIKDFKIKNGGK
ncbi:dolichyl-diphosphooligosaccharide-protein glycotransferase [Fomitiporia mediterranea MF3/22]|uniref:dolichyl-diphosphooligosaccharide-protein glycotransferase n=1 Tax=Fomitiporia mediterranea (strain MF3/22) TaxID=694068 RepID=UPI000440872C|nr:dolichyl-diphosphooligosaccharide-protein glycotransferase [Fomitiporia mediterranea MF3/22]EJD06042.1 dolichyl-diphosphooligosaccharide-protein glycotransferase [Fomitiporia mediterranea MF3/22]